RSHARTQDALLEIAEAAGMVVHPAVKAVIALFAVVLLQRQAAQMLDRPAGQKGLPLLAPLYRVDTECLIALQQPLIFQPLLEATLHIAAIAGPNGSMRALGPIQLIKAPQLVEIVDGQHLATTMIG